MFWLRNEKRYYSKYSVSALKCTCSEAIFLSLIDNLGYWLLLSIPFFFSGILTFCILLFVLGGTDIIACFLGQNWTVPVYSGEVQQFQLGCCMRCYNDEGTVEP